MWGLGGKYYWGTKKNRGVGLVVLFAWLSSQEKHLKHHVDFYSSFGWNSLVCHSQFFNLFFPDKAAMLALKIINELVRELKLAPCPIVLVSFSGGPKACMYKLLQIIEGKCEGQIYLDEYHLIRDCISGYVFDSTPVDFVSDLGTRFILHPSVLGMSRPPPLVPWIAKGISSCLDGLFLSDFESQRVEYWQTLYATITMKAPYLVFCSEDDDLAPFQVIYNFATRLRQLGGEVSLVTWKSSPHVGHFRHYHEDYKAAVAELLHKATAVYSEKIQHLDIEKSGIAGTLNMISEHSYPRKLVAAASSSSRFNGTAADTMNHCMIAGLSEYDDGQFVNADHCYIAFSITQEMIVSNNMLGRLRFDDCIARHVEDWDLRWDDIRFKEKDPHFNLMKCIGKSRL